MSISNEAKITGKLPLHTQTLLPSLGFHSLSHQLWATTVRVHLGRLVTSHQPEYSQLTSGCAICRHKSAGGGWPGTLHLSPALGEVGAAAALMEKPGSLGSGSVCSLPGLVPRRQSGQGRQLDPNPHGCSRYQQSLVHVSSSARWPMTNAGAECSG